ncbi:MAG: hypothetical protein KC766_41705 [Myxococcales bacterium]|nr:hypothetical protein [Myxococcales bacterium]
MIDCGFVRYVGLAGLLLLTACSVFPDQLSPRNSAGSGGTSSAGSGAGGSGGEGGTSGSSQGGSSASGGSSGGGDGGASGSGVGGTPGGAGGTSSAGAGGSAIGGAGGSAGGSGGSGGGPLTCPTLAANASFELVGANNHPSGWQVIYEMGSGVIWESTDIDHQSGSRSLLIDTQSVTGSPYFAGIGTNQVTIDAGATLEVSFSARIINRGDGNPSLSFDFFTIDFNYIEGRTLVTMDEDPNWVKYGPLTLDAPSNGARLTMNFDFDANARFFLDDVCFRVVQ